MRRTLATLMTLALGTVAFWGAACGDGGPPDAAKIYDEVGEKMTALASYHVEGGGEGSEGDTFQLEIDFVAPDKSQVNASFAGEGGFSAQFGIIQVGDDFYTHGIPFGPPSENFFVYSEDLFGPPPDFPAFLSAIWSQASDLTYVGEEEVGGVATHRLQGTISAEVRQLVDTGPEDLPTESATVDFWVGKDDSLVYQARQVAPGETINLTVSRFDDASITVEAPENPLPPEAVAREFIANLTDQQRDCLRGKWGEAVYEEISGGTRFPTDEEEAKAEECGIE